MKKKIIFQQGAPKLEEAVQYCEQALSADRYNARALVNRGNIFFILGDLDKAAQYYKEALSNEVSDVVNKLLQFIIPSFKIESFSRKLQIGQPN